MVFSFVPYIKLPNGPRLMFKSRSLRLKCFFSSSIFSSSFIRVSPIRSISSSVNDPPSTLRMACFSTSLRMSSTRVSTSFAKPESALSGPNFSLDSSLFVSFPISSESLSSDQVLNSILFSLIMLITLWRFQQNYTGARGRSKQS